MIREIRRYFFVRPRRPQHVPRQYTYEYDIRLASTDELRMMRRGYAKTPLEARLLLDGATAEEYMQAHPRPTWWQLLKRHIRAQFISMVMRIEGSTDQRPKLKQPKSERYKIPMRYVFDREDK